MKKIGCDLTQMNEKLLDKTVPTVFYLKCNHHAEVQLTVFHKRGNFYWIGKGNSNKKKAKWFGDFPRGMNKFNTIVLENIGIEVPEDINRFLFDYEHSKFIECDKASSKRVREKMGKNYTLKSKMQNGLISSLVYVTSALEKFGKNYWLAAGILLGWYRECGFVPHTNDIDIAMWDYEYEESIKNYFRGNREVALGIQLGFVKEAFELRLLSKYHFAVDIFLIYKLNKTYQWQGYQGHRLVFRQLLPFMTKSDLCSGELYNNKFIVPCDPIKYLTTQYGLNSWRFPLTNAYFNSKTLIYYKNWTDIEWPYALRYFNIKTGKINTNWTLTILKKYSNNSITLPNDID